MVMTILEAYNLITGFVYPHVRLVHKTSLLHRLQEYTLPDVPPPIDKIHPFRKMAVTFEPLMRL